MLKKELKPIIKIYGRFPTKREITEEEQKQNPLYAAINQHGGMDVVAKKLNMQRSVKKSYSETIRKKHEINFLNNAKNIWGKEYDYSQVKYENSKANVTIICYEHGPFQRIPNDHTNKTHPNGCPKCGLQRRAAKRRLPLKKFIERGIKKFGNKYDYSEVNIINVDSDVLIGCPIHGVIPMTPYAHYKSKTGCKKCGVMLRSLNSRLPKNDFIIKAANIWDNKYDYSQIEYEGVSKNIYNIKCKEHNQIFKMIGSSHLAKAEGCEKCLGRQRLTMENFFWKDQKSIMGINMTTPKW